MPAQLYFAYTKLKCFTVISPYHNFYHITIPSFIAIVNRIILHFGTHLNAYRVCGDPFIPQRIVIRREIIGTDAIVFPSFTSMVSTIVRCPEFSGVARFFRMSKILQGVYYFFCFGCMSISCEGIRVHLITMGLLHPNGTVQLFLFNLCQFM